MAVSAEAYNAVVVDHFHRPRNFGRLPSGHGVIEARAGSGASGTLFLLSAEIHQGAVRSVRAQVLGCPHCIAAASLASEQLQGASADRLANWTWREIAEPLQVPPHKRGHLLFLEDAVHALGRQMSSSR